MIFAPRTYTLALSVRCQNAEGSPGRILRDRTTSEGSPLPFISPGSFQPPGSILNLQTIFPDGNTSSLSLGDQIS